MKEGYHQELGKIVSVSCGLYGRGDEEFCVKLGIEVKIGGFAQQITIEKCKELLNDGNYKNVTDLLNHFCIVDAEDIPGSPLCYFNRLTEAHFDSRFSQEV